MGTLEGATLRVGQTVWIGETRPDPAALAEALRVEQDQHADGCPFKVAAVLPCRCDGVRAPA